MRIAVGQLWQETNTFNPLPTTRRDFEPLGIHLGADVVDFMANVNELGGFIQTLRCWPEQPHLVGLARFAAWPSGPATRDTVAGLLNDMIQQLLHVLPVDAVYLALHGAMVAEGMPDVEGELLRQVRELIGPKTPLVASLDLHTNITRLMVEHADALVLYHTAPHIDVFETGHRAAHVLRKLLVDRVPVVTAFQKIPMVVPAECANTQDSSSVSHGLHQDLKRCEADPEVLCAGLATVQPWLDIPEMGSASVVTAVNPKKAELLCRDLAQELWDRRRDYLPELVDLPEAVRLAHGVTDGLVVLGDGADSTNSGSTGEGTAILSELIKLDWARPALVTLVAPYAVEEANRRGVGAAWEASLGGVRDCRFSAPIRLPVEVEKLFHAKFTLTGHIGKNMPIDMGPAAVLRHKNVHVLVTTQSGPLFAPDFFRAAGFDPFAASVLVAKSPCGFRAAYQGAAKQIYMVRAPGCAPSDFWKHDYRNIPRPLWPWDEISEWSPAPILRTR